MLKPGAIAPPVLSIWPTRRRLKRGIERCVSDTKPGRKLAVRIVQCGQIATAKIRLSLRKYYHRMKKISRFSLWIRAFQIAQGLLAEVAF
jgi:hypothetical protein